MTTTPAGLPPGVTHALSVPQRWLQDGQTLRPDKGIAGRSLRISGWVLNQYQSSDLRTVFGTRKTDDAPGWQGQKIIATANQAGWQPFIHTYTFDDDVTEWYPGIYAAAIPQAPGELWYVADLLLEDVTDEVKALADVNATLMQDYMTAVETDTAIAAARTALEADLGLLQADLTDIQGLDLNALSGTAIGAMLAELNVAANGQIAGVSQFGNAMADMLGNAQASVGFRAIAGGQSGDLELVAWEDLNGGGAALLANVDLFAARGSISTSKLKVVNGSGNLLQDPTFRNGTHNLHLQHAGSGDTHANSQYWLRTYNSWRTPDFSTLELRVNNANVLDSSYTDLRFRPRDAAGNFLPGGYPVKPNTPYEFSFQVSQHRSWMQVYVLYYDVDGVYLGAGGYGSRDVGGSITGGGTVTASLDWERYGDVKMSLPNAVYAIPTVRFWKGNGSTYDYIFLHSPIFKEAHSVDDPLSVFESETATIIDGGNVIADTLNFRQAIVGDSIQSDNYVPGVDGLMLDFATGEIEAQGLVVNQSMIAPDAVSQLDDLTTGVEAVATKHPWDTAIDTIAGSGSHSLSGIYSGGGFGGRGVASVWVAGKAPSDGDLFITHKLGTRVAFTGYHKIRAGQFKAPVSGIINQPTASTSYTTDFEFVGFTGNTEIYGSGHYFLGLQR